MFQGTLFEGATVRKDKSKAPAAGLLPFTGFTESKARGEIHPVWLNATLDELARRGTPAPTLTDLQTAWDDGLSWSAAADRLTPAPVPTPEVSPAGRQSDDQGDQGDGLTPAERLDNARKMVRNGASIRWAANAAGVPVTTLRRALGLVNRRANAAIMADVDAAELAEGW